MHTLREVWRGAACGRYWRFASVLLIVLQIVFTSFRAYAVAPDEILSDPSLEARARHLSKQLRCLVCQNQSIDDSDAPLAKDLRVLVRERLVKGDTDPQAMAFIVDRYGTFVLLRPPVQTNTILLWLAPVLLLGAMLVGFRQHLAGRHQGRSAAALSAEEALRLKKILDT